ncbi:small T-antigen [Bat mastadenovirus]|uniref:E1B protein, small T-antigen n=1 Tax=Bat mastadenovirus TaxID=740971 RepID=A0A3G9ET96_9ADEN|nr:small T-antigen [Bat mastadenovirus]BBE29300.1 small T-antigen [Bat mastadenovirus]
MDPLSACNSYDSFRHMIRGSLLPPGWIRRWCLSSLSDIVGTISVSSEARFTYSLPDDHLFWSLFKKGFTIGCCNELFEPVDLSNRGRVLAFFAFVSFLLRKWPADSVVPQGERLDLICVPAWSRMQLWKQATAVLEKEDEEDKAEADDDSEEETLVEQSGTDTGDSDEALRE